jgi:hypothetical protein
MFVTFGVILVVIGTCLVRRTPSSSGRVLLLLTAWAISCAAHAMYFVASTLALPDIPDAYARTVGFQLLMFVMFRLPLWLLALALLVVSLMEY